MQLLRRQLEESFRRETILMSVAYPNPQDVIQELRNIPITPRDLDSLREENWVNDNIINYYMSMITERGKRRQINGKRTWPTVYSFNSFFFPKLLKQGYQGVKKWTSKIDLFSYDLVFVPLHLRNDHWCLAVVDFEKKEVLSYDSLGKDNTRCLTTLLHFLQDEHRERKDSSNEFDVTSYAKVNEPNNVPHQVNGNDCGVFLCQFAEFLSRSEPFSFTGLEMPFYRQKMICDIMEKKIKIP
jgi:sentrin-specific protease 1